MWIVLRIVALLLALCPILYMYKSEEPTQKQKNVCVVFSSVGIILFIITIFMRFS